MEATFRECVQEERQHGRTVLLSSHILAEAEALSDRVTIIRDGRAVETGTLAEMRHLTRDFVDAELAGPVSLDGLPGVHDLVTDGLRVRCRWITPPWMRSWAACTRPASGPSPAGRRPSRNSSCVIIRSERSVAGAPQ